MSKVFGVPLQELLKADKQKHPSLKVPFFVDQALQHIIRNGFDSEGVFRLSGNSDTVQKLKEQIDSGQEIDFIKTRAAVNDVCSLFKMYLRSLPDPLLTSERYRKWLQIHELSDKNEQLKRMKELINELPECNRDVLSLIIPLLSKIAMNSHVNKMGVDNLSKVLGPNMLWKEVGQNDDPALFLVEAGKLNDIIELMINEHTKLMEDRVGTEYEQWAKFHCKVYGHKKSILCVAPGFEEKHMWSCDSTGAIRIWDVSNIKVVKEIDSEQGRIFSMSRITDKHMWTASQKCAKIWDTETWDCIKEIEGFTYCMTRVGENVWVGGEGKISVYDLEFNFVKDMEVSKGIVILSMCLDSKGEFLWTGATDKNIRIWDIETCTQVKSIKKSKVNGFASFGNQMWSGDDNSLCVWNATSFELIKELQGHEGAVYDFESTGKYMWSASWDTTIRLWDTETLESICTFRNYHSDAVSQIRTLWNETSQCWQAWTGSWDKSMVVWNLGSKNQLPTGRISQSSNNNHVAARDEGEEAERTASRLEQQSQRLAQRRESIEERKKNLTLRKLALEKKKEALMKKKQELLGQE